MKQIILFLSLLIIFTSCKQDKSAEVIQFPKLKYTLIKDVQSLAHCESAVFDKNTNRIYASLIGFGAQNDGSIAILDTDGTIINSKFIDSLNDPKGIAITKNRLYVSDVNKLVEANLATGEILKVYTYDKAYFLNDVEIDANNNVYVSDTNGSAIFKLNSSDGHFDIWLSDKALDSPNGLFLKDKIMYTASWGGQNGGRVSKIDMITKKIDTLTGIIGNLDGITPYDDNFFLISDWNSGNIHLMDYYGNTKKILYADKSVGDIGFVKDKRLLLLPMNIQNSLLFYKLEEE